MRRISAKKAVSAENKARIEEIHQQMQDICEPHYDEFYRVTTEYGFTKITLPKRRGN